MDMARTTGRRGNTAICNDKDVGIERVRNAEWRRSLEHSSSIRAVG